MGQNFISGDRDQVLLLPPDLRSWLPEGHLALFVVDAVGELDLSAFYARYRADGHGRPAYDPAVMVALVLYAYAKGVRSARETERRCVEDVAFRVVAANLSPDHATIARFRAEHELALGALFGQVLAMCERAGLVRAGVLAVDSTKIAANASGQANMDYEQLAREILKEAARIDAAEDELYGDKRGDELPPELADPKMRKARIRELLDELDAEQQAEQAARQAMLERRAEHERRTGRKPPGRPPVEQPKAQAKPRRVNVTDPDSRSVRTPRGFIQGYNAHAVAGDGQIIIAADVTLGTRDQGHLEPMITAAAAELAAAGASAPEVVLADAGYWVGDQIRRLSADGLTVLVPPDGAKSGPNPQRRGGLYEHMRERLASDDGGELYRRRMSMIEPIFGQTKTNRRADRFQRRGLPAVRSEWRLITATHNMLKLWRATTTPAAA